MSKITMKNSVTTAETFDSFMMSRKAKGLTEKTISSYYSHFICISKHLNIDIQIEDLIKTDLESMIASMRDSGLSSNSNCRDSGLYFPPRVPSISIPKTSRSNLISL